MADREELSGKLNRLWGRGLKEEKGSVRTPVVRLGSEVGIHFLLGAVLAGGILFERYAPFGVALVAASGSGLCGGAALLGACFGYLLLLPFAVSLRYMSAAILTFAVSFAFYDVRLLQRPWAMALVAGLMNTSTGLVYLAQRNVGTAESAFFLTETGAVVGAAFCFRQVLLPLRLEREEWEWNGRRRGTLLVLVCCVLISLSGLTIWEELSLGRVAAVVCVLAGAWKGGCASGAVLGVSMGIAMDVSYGQSPLYAMAWGGAALAAGSCRGARRQLAAIAFLLGNGAATLWLWGSGMRMSSLGEAAAGAAVFLVLPEKLWRELAPLVEEGEVPGERYGYQYVRQRLEQTAAAFRSLYESMRGSFRAPRNDNDVAVVFDRAACQVCRKCTQRLSCWERDYVSTFNALNDATAAMLARGKGEAEDFPRYFSDRCIHFSAFLGVVNQELYHLAYRRQYNARLQESRLAVCRQYGELSALLGKAAAELSCELLPDQTGQRKLRQYLSACGMELEQEVFRDEYGRLRACIYGDGWQEAAQEEHLSQLERVLGVPLRAEEEKDRLQLVQLEPLMAVAGVAARKKEGETVSGDAGTYFKREDGILCVLLCDGMGSGTLASQESRLAVRLLEQFLQAGVDTEHALITLSAALGLRGEVEGGFTTIDLLEVDLFSGESSVYKLGAAPTYIRHGGSVRKITGTALPAGLSLGESGRPDCTRLRLEPGDYVLMVSDGVAGTGADDWIGRRLRDFSGESPRELASSLITDSPEGATDDRTALVVSIRRRKEKLPPPERQRERKLS